MDIEPGEVRQIRESLARAFPGHEIDHVPKPDLIATLFRVIERSEVRHQLLVHRRYLDDVRGTPSRLSAALEEAVGRMRQVGTEVVELG